MSVHEVSADFSLPVAWRSLRPAGLLEVEILRMTSAGSRLVVTWESESARSAGDPLMTRLLTVQPGQPGTAQVVPVASWWARWKPTAGKIAAVVGVVATLDSLQSHFSSLVGLPRARVKPTVDVVRVAADEVFSAEVLAINVSWDQRNTVIVGEDEVHPRGDLADLVENLRFASITEVSPPLEPGDQHSFRVQGVVPAGSLQKDRPPLRGTLEIELGAKAGLLIPKADLTAEQALEIWASKAVGEPSVELTQGASKVAKVWYPVWFGRGTHAGYQAFAKITEPRDDLHFAGNVVGFQVDCETNRRTGIEVVERCDLQPPAAPWSATFHIAAAASFTCASLCLHLEQDQELTREEWLQTLKKRVSIVLQLSRGRSQ